MVAGILEKSNRFRLAVFCCAMYKAPQSVPAAHAGPCPPLRDNAEIRCGYLLSHGKGRGPGRSCRPYFTQKTDAPAGTVLPVSAACGVVQSRDHLIREFGT